MNIVDRFVEYAKIDTQSNPKSETVPSTEKQKNLGNLLVKQLKEMGIENAHIDEKGYVYAHLKSNVDRDLKKVGFIAHMDTATELTGANVNPQFVDYKGGDIKLNDEVTMSVKEFPCLNEVVGERLITTDGNTLLGADDKSGIAIIMDAIQNIISNNLPHGDISIGFTPDEEIGRGADHFDVAKFGAYFAYTIDGGAIGELEYESFNAAGAVFKIRGKSVHPGTAKGKLINASLIAAEVVNSFPADEVPEKTEGYEGFYFLDKISANCEEAELSYILRDHDREKFEMKKKFAANVAKKINEKYGKELVSVEIKDQYYNMGEIIKDHMNVVEIAEKAMKNLGIKPIIQPIRGGTDGSKISFMGLPTPNIFAGGENFHGKYEFVALESMILATDVIVEIVKLNGEGK